MNNKDGKESLLGKLEGKATRLLLTRHGKTEWNADHRIQGHSDIDLNEEGVAQAEALAARMNGSAPSIIYSSDLIRASRTASIIQKNNHGSRHIVTPLLRERNWGAFEGKKWLEIENEFPKEIKMFHSHPLDFRPENGESRGDVLKRIEEFLAGILQEHPGEFIGVVTHGGVCSLMIKLMIGMDLENITPFRIENCSISIMDNIRENTWFVHCLNDMAHLKGAKIL